MKYLEFVSVSVFLVLQALFLYQKKKFLFYISTSQYPIAKAKRKAETKTFAKTKSKLSVS